MNVDARNLRELAKSLERFLSLRPHPMGNPYYTIPRLIRDLDIDTNYSEEIKKREAILIILKDAAHQDKKKFVLFVINTIVRGAQKRRSEKRPITLDEVKHIREKCESVGLRISKLYQDSFLESLPIVDSDSTNLLRSLNQIKEIHNPQEIGKIFERFLKEFFNINGLSPSSSFYNSGEEIDGSFQLGQSTYILEAKWCKQKIGTAELYKFHTKVDGRPHWTHGIFVSYNGFTQEGLEAIARGHKINFICVDGNDLIFCLEKISISRRL